MEEGRVRRGLRKQCMFCFKTYPREEIMCPHCGHEEGSGKRKSFYLEAGTELYQGRYIIGEAVRNGGFGILYRAFDTKLQTLVAIKEYFPSSLVNRQPGEVKVSLNYEDEEYQLEYHRGIRDFIMEARIMLKFPNDECVCNTYTYFEENSTAYIVMEFIDGISLREYIKLHRAKNISEETSLGFMRQILSGLATIHKANVVHRDIAPDNILVLENGAIKIIDFGASCIRGKKRLKDEVIFKPGFAPPEQYDEFSEIGPWLDIYAAGATFYYLLTGKVPPDSPEREKDDTLIPPMELNPTVSRQVNAAVVYALAPKIENRIQSAEDFQGKIDGKKVHTPKEREFRNKARKLAGWMALFATMVLVTVAVMLRYKKLGESANNKLIVWIGVPGNADAAAAEIERYRAVFERFCSANKELSLEDIDIVAVPEKTISERFISTAKGSRPDLLEVTYATEDVKEELMYLSFLRDAFPSQTGAIKAATTLLGFKGYPLSRAILLRFTTIEDEETKEKLQKFESVISYINGSGNRYLEMDNSGYDSIYRCFEGKYTLEDISEETAWYVDFFGINKQSRNPELSKKLLEYMAGAEAQRCLHIEGSSRMLPVEERALRVYLEERPELQFLKEKLESYEPVILSKSLSLFRENGTETARVPQVVGLKEEEAIRRLEEQKLSASLERAYQDEIEEGVVFWQAVEEGKCVFTNTPVKIKISNGPKKNQEITPEPTDEADP